MAGNASPPPGSLRSARLYWDQMQTGLQLKVWGQKRSHIEKVKHVSKSAGPTDKQHQKVRQTNKRVLCNLKEYTYLLIVKNIMGQWIFFIMYNILTFTQLAVFCLQPYTHLKDATMLVLACIVSSNSAYLMMIVCSSLVKRASLSTNCCTLVYVQ